MVKHAGNHKQRYVDIPGDISKLICTVNDNGHFSEQCKVLNDVGTRYATIRPFKVQ